MMDDLLTRRGEFMIALSAIELRPRIVLLAMDHVLVSRAECLYHKGIILYSAWSELFDTVGRTTESPIYEPVVDMVNNVVSWKRHDCSYRDYQIRQRSVAGNMYIDRPMEPGSVLR